MQRRGIPESIELTPIAFFNLFWDDSILNTIVEDPSAYALAKHAQVESSSCLRLRKWKPLNVVNLKRFISATTTLGATRLPSRRLYWSFQRGGILSKSALSFNYYAEIKRYLHISMPTALPLAREDWWQKLEPLSSHLRKRSQELYRLSTRVAVMR